MTTVPTSVRRPAPEEIATTLTPGQAQAYAHLVSILPGTKLAHLRGEAGSGKSMVLRRLAADTGGAYLTTCDLLEAMRGRAPDRLAETLAGIIATAFRNNDLVVFDDLEMFGELGGAGNLSAERSGFLVGLLDNAIAALPETGKTLVTASAGEMTTTVNGEQAVHVDLAAPGPADYAMLLGSLLRQDMGDFDIDALGRGFRRLTCYELAIAARMLKAETRLPATATEVIAQLDALHLHSNVDLDEVEAVSLDGLVGVEEIVRTLRRTVLLPMTEPALARDLGLTPKRGILLYGEPGTGKTTIGRALAHDMKGRFFMIDGTFVPTAPDFEMRVNAVLSAAEASSPSVLFIDDADVIFRHGQQTGFARKLLTKLDGLESATQANVCIVMTAMDIADMPPAMLRSGRVEVWLEMRLPDVAKRLAIIRHYAASLPVEFALEDEAAVAAATAGFTPADLRGLVGDARGHLAYDRHRGRRLRTFDEYLVMAAGDIAGRKAIMSQLRL
ncbi:ATPase family associated with various cellular activities (AAA) [Novosphingobium sp. CF614]|uniref:AAA family ATPase n=1 Tax=Novosphingobium sp. CF614 TaxID=1884364 RepID=UPI0008E4FA97|nr:AAA family ATPase [Novosphingobium sp. CF614]SFF92294.1 ATPase family associated with various cellular activities (AAA) [Novosphingobium sp. CF614]